MKVIAGLMMAGVLVGVAAPAFAGSPAPAPSATPLGDTISIELSPEWYAPGAAHTGFADTYAKIGFSHSLGQGFSWGAAVQDTFAPPGSAGSNGWNGETTLGYKFKQDAFTFGVSGGVGYSTSATGDGTYYLVSGTADWKLDPKWTWNVINARWRDAFAGAWATPKVATGFTYAIDARQSVYLAAGYAWKNGAPDKENLALGYKLGF